MANIHEIWCPAPTFRCTERERAKAIAKAWVRVRGGECMKMVNWQNEIEWDLNVCLDRYGETKDWETCELTKWNSNRHGMESMV